MNFSHEKECLRELVDSQNHEMLQHLIDDIIPKAYSAGYKEGLYEGKCDLLEQLKDRLKD